MRSAPRLGNGQPGPRQGDRGPDWSFLLRWGGAVTVAIGLAGLGEYAYASDQLQRRVLESALEQQSVHIEHLEEIFAEGARVHDAVLQAELEEIAQAYEVRYVALFDVDGALIAGAGPDSAAEAEEDDSALAAKVRDAAATGRPSAGREPDSGQAEGGRFEFLIPFDTPKGLMVLEVDQRSEVVDALIMDLRERKLLGLLASVVLAVPLSYLFGGRALQRRQEVADRAADTDALTGLAGRRPFRPAVERALAVARTGDGPIALALIDIDEFKQVNDRLGHSYGDRVLVALASALGALRAGDTAFRLGGDEFAVLLTRSTDEQAVEVIDRVRASFAEHAPGITFSCGVASTEMQDTPALQELWERADAALYEAKRSGRRQTVTFSATASAITISVDKLDAVRALLEPGTTLHVAFQPIWDLEAGVVLGHEALLRLPGEVPLSGPQEAFALAQRLGLAAELDAAARRAVLHDVGGRSWKGALFLNVHPEALRTLNVTFLTAEILAAGLAVQDVILEITEQADLDHPEPIRALKALRANGFRLALDDMGHGNAGLRALTHVPFDVIKIDRDVIARLSTDAAAQATVAAATTFVQRSGGWVIAEGIEDLAMLTAVTRSDLGSEGAAPILGGQGYLLGRPVRDPLSSQTQITEVLRSRTQPAP